MFVILKDNIFVLSIGDEPKNKQKTHKMKKTEKLELEIMAIQLWWQSFGKTGLSEEKHRLYMSEKLITLKQELDNLQNRKQSWS